MYIAVIRVAGHQRRRRPVDSSMYQLPAHPAYRLFARWVWRRRTTAGNPSSEPSLSVNSRGLKLVPLPQQCLGKGAGWQLHQGTPPVSMQYWTKFVQPGSASPHNMAFPHLMSMLRRTRLLRAEHSAPSTRKRPNSSRSPLPMSSFPSVVFPALASQEFSLTNAQPMLGRSFGAGFCLTSTLEQSVNLFAIYLFV
ncbi:hypothetical protein T08_3665 [Trichinella sp. T8]|nr:hypothetical protein T08_3665 [Trichinella sp. T8]